MKTKKILVSIFLIMLIFFGLIKPVNANIFTDDWDNPGKKDNVGEIIEKEDGGLFEKIIARMIRRTCRNSF